MEKNDCRHTNLLVITENTDRLRCLHCHLTLKAEEMQSGHCPECLEVTGRERDDFEKIETGEKKVQYRCEDCGALLNPAAS